MAHLHSPRPSPTWEPAVGAMFGPSVHRFYPFADFYLVGPWATRHRTTPTLERGILTRKGDVICPSWALGMGIPRS